MKNLIILEPVDIIWCHDESTNLWIIHPQAQEFISMLFNGFKVGIWSRLENSTLETLIRETHSNFQFEFILGRNQCRHFSNTFLEKRLKTINHLGFSPDRTIVIDNRIPIRENYNNTLVAPLFTKSSTDDLIAFAEQILQFEHSTYTRNIAD